MLLRHRFITSLLLSLSVWAGIAPAAGEEAPLTPLAALGQRMFFDPSLSASGEQSCATCHDPRRAYGPRPGQGIALGGKNMKQHGTRAVPSLRYLRGSPAFALKHRFIDGDIAPIGGFTWDGRAASIRDQAQLPLLAANEMANATPAAVVRKIRRGAYASQFRALFGEHIFKDPARAFGAALDALDAFQNTSSQFFPYSSRYDAFLRGELELTPQEERGVALFKDPQKGNCASCHLTSTRGGAPPAFTDYDFANVGVPRNRRIPANADPSYFDLGLCGPLRQDLVGEKQYCGFFRAPTLRNVAIRDTFFHNGAFTNLREAVQFYVNRDLTPEKFYPRAPDGSVNKADDLPPGYPDNLDHDPPLDRVAGQRPALSDEEIDDLIAFLETLTDADVIQTKTALDWRTPWLEEHDPRQAMANSDEYAWRLFLALNWPADRSSRLGTDGPVAWELWENANEVYLQDGRDPGPWPNRRAACGIADENRFETFSLKDFPNGRHIVRGRMVPVADPLASARNLTEIRMNRTAFDFVRARGLYNLDGQLRLAREGSVVNFPAGSTEVKAKWRPIRDEDRARYHTVKVRFADGTQRLYGLTALHIVSKDLPQWFWATFEHVDNPTLPDGEGWQLPSVDRFACAGESADCNRAPQGIGLEGTLWQNYRLRGTLTGFVDAANRPLLLANSQLEAGFQKTSSCITCHSRSAIATVSGATVRLPVFDTISPCGDALMAGERRGYVGLPRAQWFENPAEGGRPLFRQLDFVWSLSKARPRRRGPHDS